jgi:hypothetical protein
MKSGTSTAAPRAGAPASSTPPATAAPRRSRARSQAAAGSGLDRSGASHGHSAVEALLAEHIEQAQEQIAALHPRPAAGPEKAEEPRAEQDPAEPARAGRRAAPPPAPRTRPTTPAAAPLPPVDDVLLGLASVVAENAWRIGSAALAAVSGAANHAVAVFRGVAPGYASAQADARLNALAERGRRVREERTEALNAAMTGAITSAATSDAVREMTVAAIEEATDDVLAVMLPAVLEAVTELETQERLDELMAGLLLRQLPSALEKTLPGVMIRTATRPALGLMPFLGGALPRGQ